MKIDIIVLSDDLEFSNNLQKKLLYQLQKSR